MAADFDAKATAVTHQVTNTSPITNSVTVTAAGTVVIAAFYCGLSVAGTLAVPTGTPTCGGVNMTLIGNKTQTNSQGNVYIYALLNPGSGSKTVSVSFSAATAAGGAFAIDLDCWSMKGTDTSVIATAIPSANVITDASTTGATTYPTTAITVTTASGDVTCFAGNANFTSIVGMTIGTAINVEGATDVNCQSGYNKAVGATTQLQATVNVNGGFPACAVAFRIQKPVPVVTVPPFMPGAWPAPRVRYSVIGAG